MWNSNLLADVWLLSSRWAKGVTGRLAANNKPHSGKVHFYPLQVFIENVLDWIGVGIAEINRMGTLKSLQKEPLPSRTIIILGDFSLEPNRLDLVDPR